MSWVTASLRLVLGYAWLPPRCQSIERAANVLALLEESSYRAGAHRLQREIAAMPGPEEAVLLIEEVAAAAISR